MVFPRTLSSNSETFLQNIRCSVVLSARSGSLINTTKKAKNIEGFAYGELSIHRTVYKDYNGETGLFPVVWKFSTGDKLIMWYT